MNDTIFYLPSCSTCTRILKELKLDNSTGLRDIKSHPISGEELDEMAHMAGSFEALFSRRAIKYKTLGLKDKTLDEGDYRRLILDEYTFLKRPVFVLSGKFTLGTPKPS